MSGAQGTQSFHYVMIASPEMIEQAESVAFEVVGDSMGRPVRRETTRLKRDPSVRVLAHGGQIA